VAVASDVAIAPRHQTPLRTLIARCRNRAGTSRRRCTNMIFSREIFDIDAMAEEDGDGIGGRLPATRQQSVSGAGGPWSTCQDQVLRFTRKDVASVHKIRTPRDKWLFIIPLWMTGRVRWDGCTVSPDSQIVCPPSSEGLVVHAGASEFAIVSVAAPDGVELVERDIAANWRRSCGPCVITPAGE
jgi:hypothetical protein